MIVATLPQLVVGGFGGVLILAGAVLIAFALGFGGRRDAYDSIGAGIFDRTGGNDGLRPPCDAEYEEFGAALAAMCDDADDRPRRVSGTRRSGCRAPARGRP